MALFLLTFLLILPKYKILSSVMLLLIFISVIIILKYYRKSKKAAEEMRLQNAIILTEQRERERFAKDLHDQLGNILSSMSIYFQLIKSPTINETERSALMEFFRGLLNDAIESTKEIANNINPHVLTKHGIVQAIQMHCDKINAAGIVTIELSANLNNHILHENIEVNIYKIITELISNSLKHACSNTIKITLSVHNKLMNLEYHDNGIGFDYEQKIKERSNNGMGLSNIASRVECINGTLKFENKKGEGMRVFINTNID